MKRLTTEEFIKKANKIHNNKYDYSKSIYNKAQDKIIIICPIHGEFIQSAYHHLYGSGCYECKKEKIGNLKRSSKEQFIEKANKVHNNKYDYSLAKYVNNHTKIKIICKEHGIFEMQPLMHLQGQACKFCKQTDSRGVLKIKDFFNKNNIKYSIEKKFSDCKGKVHRLPFDFYLQKYNLLIEFQGSQHYFVKWSYKAFNDTQVTDQIKRDYCQKNGINLLEISYKDFNRIEEILKENLIL
jgi:hypothetical protein